MPIIDCFVKKIIKYFSNIADINTVVFRLCEFTILIEFSGVDRPM